MSGSRTAAHRQQRCIRAERTVFEMICAFQGHGTAGFVGLCVMEANNIREARADLFGRLADCLPHPRILHFAHVAIPPSQALSRIGDLLERKGHSRIGAGDGVRFYNAADPSLEGRLQEAFDLLGVPSAWAYRGVSESTDMFDSAEAEADEDDEDIDEDDEDSDEDDENGGEVEVDIVADSAMSLHGTSV